MSGTLTDPGPMGDPDDQTGSSNVDAFDDQSNCTCGCEQKAQNCPNR